MKYSKKSKKRNGKGKTLQSTITFDKKIAKRFSKTTPYEAQAKNMASYDFIESEKVRLSTPKSGKVTSLLKYYKNLGDSGYTSPTGRLLQGIYQKNCKAALEGNVALNTHLMDILYKPETLLLAYKAIKGNKGAMTKAAGLSLESLGNFTQEQLELYYKTSFFRDGFNLRDILLVSELLRKGLSP
jgi:hypothetical protein